MVLHVKFAGAKIEVEPDSVAVLASGGGERGSTGSGNGLSELGERCLLIHFQKCVKLQMFI